MSDDGRRITYEKPSEGMAIGEETSRAPAVNSQTVHNTKGTRAHTHRELIYRGGLVEQPRVRRHCGPLCSKLVAAISGSICIAVVVSDL